MAKTSLHAPVHPVRFVTAASLFDGHDASINIMRRILQSQGAEVIHLGHNRSVDEVLVACLQEDVQGVAVSSYQGGHVEYFKYLVDQLRARGAANVRVYGGGGGTIVAKEIAELEAYGVEKIFSPEDGQRLGLAGMINTMIATCDVDPVGDGPPAMEDVFAGDQRALARIITALECDALPEEKLEELRRAAGGGAPPPPRVTRPRGGGGGGPP